MGRSALRCSPCTPWWPTWIRGNHLFAGKPIYVQRQELDDALNEDDYTIREWVEAPGVQYVPVVGEFQPAARS